MARCYSNKERRLHCLQRHLEVRCFKGKEPASEQCFLRSESNNLRAFKPAGYVGLYTFRIGAFRREKQHETKGPAGQKASARLVPEFRPKTIVICGPESQYLSPTNYSGCTVITVLSYVDQSPNTCPQHCRLASSGAHLRRSGLALM